MSKYFVWNGIKYEQKRLEAMGLSFSLVISSWKLMNNNLLNPAN